MMQIYLTVQSKIIHCVHIVELNYNIVDDKKINFIETILSNIVVETIFWNLYFDQFLCK